MNEYKYYKQASCSTGVTKWEIVNFFKCVSAEMHIGLLTHFSGAGVNSRNSFGPVVGRRRVRPTIAKRVSRVHFVTEDKTAKLTFPCNGKIRLQIKYLYVVPTGNTILPTPRGKRGIFLSHVFTVFFWSESPVTGVAVLSAIVLSEWSDPLHTKFQDEEGRRWLGCFETKRGKKYMTSSQKKKKKYIPRIQKRTHYEREIRFIVTKRH